MEYLAHRHGEVPSRFKVLWHGGVVPRMDSPVRVEVVEPGRVRSATCQHGRPTGSAHSLLRGQHTFSHFKVMWSAWTGIRQQHQPGHMRWEKLGFWTPVGQCLGILPQSPHSSPVMSANRPPWWKGHFSSLKEKRKESGDDCHWSTHFTL